MRILRFIGIFSFALLYCFNVTYGGSSIGVKVSLNKSSTSASTYTFKEILAHPVGQISRDANHLVPGNPPSKNLFTNRAVSGKIQEQVESIKFCQYHFYYRNLRNSFENTDIIYPFHYHW